MLTGQSLWFRPDIPIKDSYLELLEGTYFAEAYKADFANSPVAVKAAMDEWASQKTAGLIDDLPIEIDPSNVFYLLQALYFKDSWSMPFQVENNNTGSFTRADGSSIDATFMNQNYTQTWGYVGDSFTAADLITEQGFSMRIVLPNETLAINEAVELEGLYDVLFSDHLMTYESTRFDQYFVDWSLPKFDVKSTIDLKTLLADLGVETVQGSAADFSNAADVQAGDYYLDTAVQQTRIKVDEKGLEAAAVTILGASETSAPVLEHFAMILDRPFIFTISAPSGLPLFIAYVGDVSP